MRVARTLSGLALASILTATVVQPATQATAVPTGAVARSDSSQPSEASPFVKSATVRLVSGDLVRVLTRADGSALGTVLPGSPHEGAPVVRWRTQTGNFVLPRTPSSVLRRLDLSLFDVTALERHGDRVPIRVRFRAGVAVTRLPGVRLDSTTMRITSRGAVIEGWYGRSFQGFSADDLAKVSSVRLASADPAPPEAPTHQVTVNVVDKEDQPVPGVVVTLINVQNADIVQDISSRKGVARFDVPAGPYSALGFDFRHFVIAPEFDVTSAAAVELDTSTATVKPKVILPGHRALDAALGVSRTAETGFTFPFSFTGPRFFTRVQPATAEVAHGELTSGVSATLAPEGSGGSPDQLAITADISPGIPDDLTYEHRRRDFAKVVQRLFANGPPGLRTSFFGAGGSVSSRGYVDLFSGREFAVQVPGRRTVLLQASPHTFFQQTVMPLSTPNDGDDLSQLIAVGRPGPAGSTRVVDFAHGPVGPGYRGTPLVDRDYLARVKGRLVGHVPLFNGSGSTTIGFADRDNSDWSLRSGRKLLAKGRGDVRLRTAVPQDERTYVLTGTSRPTSPNWTLSTLVRDVWTFRLRGERAAAALLTPRYTPPVSLSGMMPAGLTSFRLDIPSLTRDVQPIKTARLQLSTDDGRSWTDARLERLSSTAFRVTYRNPGAGPTRRFMSIRVVARSAGGDRVVETAMRVYRLR